MIVSMGSSMCVWDEGKGRENTNSNIESRKSSLCTVDKGLHTWSKYSAISCY